jgi:hypothetical protein
MSSFQEFTLKVEYYSDHYQMKSKALSVVICFMAVKHKTFCLDIVEMSWQHNVLLCIVCKATCKQTLRDTT